MVAIGEPEFIVEPEFGLWVGDACIRDNESICRTFDVNDSRFAFGTGEFLVVRVGDCFGVDIGIDELFRLELPSDESFRMLCAESGR